MNSFNSMKNSVNVLNSRYGTFRIRDQATPFLYVAGRTLGTNAIFYDNSNIIVKTITNVSNNKYEIFIVNYTKYGILNWTSRIAGLIAITNPINVVTDSQNNVYVMGIYQFNNNDSINIYNKDDTIFKTLPTSGGASTNDYDTFIVKYNSSGMAQWATRIGGTSDDKGVNISLDSSNNIYVTGYYISSTSTLTFYNSTDTNTSTFKTISPAGVGIYIAKYNGNNGIGIWATKMTTSNTNGALPTNLIIDSQNNVYISGYYYGNLTLYNSTDTTFNTIAFYSSPDVFLAKYDSSGNGIWTTRIVSSSTITTDMIFDSGKDIYITGYYNSAIIFYNTIDTTTSTFKTLPADAGNNVFIAKYDKNGTGQWAARISGNSEERPINVVTDYLNNLYITGYFASSSLNFYNKNDTIFTTKTLAGVTGSTSRDVFLAKYSSDGNCIWATTMGGNDNDRPVNILLDSENNIYISGFYSKNTMIFYNKDGSESSTYLSNYGNSDIFIVKYNNDGNVLWGINFSSSGITDEPRNLFLDSANNLYILGNYSGSLDLYHSTGIIYKTLNFGGNTDVVIAKYSKNGIGLWTTIVSGSGTEITVKYCAAVSK
jgi:hypothetical protein